MNSKTDVTEIHIIPSLSGESGSLGKILLGAALIAIAVINPGIGGMVLSQAGVGAVAGAGIGLMIGGIMQLFMPTPKVETSDEPDPSRYLGAGGNTTEIGTLIGRGYGRLKLGGQYLSVQVDSQDMVYGTFPEIPT